MSDGPVGHAVRMKCEARFLPGYTAAERRKYRRELNHCLNMYAKQSGSLYGSLIAFCQTKQAVRRATRYDKKG